MSSFPGYPVGQSGPNPIFKILLAIAVIIVILFLVWVFYGSKLMDLKNSISKSVDASAYQAVFLMNGQVYFGRLEFSGEWASLKDVFYLQADQNIQQSTTASPNFQLVKLGSEIHGPQDELHFLTEGILFWENMKPDSQVIKSISRYKTDVN